MSSIEKYWKFIASRKYKYISNDWTVEASKHHVQQLESNLFKKNKQIAFKRLLVQLKLRDITWNNNSEAKKNNIKMTTEQENYVDWVKWPFRSTNILLQSKE